MSERTRKRSVQGDLKRATAVLTTFCRLTIARRNELLTEAGKALRESFDNNFELAIKNRKALLSAIAAGFGGDDEKLYGRKRVVPPPGVAVPAEELEKRKLAESVRGSVNHLFQKVINAAFPGQLRKHIERGSRAKGRKQKEAWRVYVLQCRPRWQQRNGAGSGAAAESVLTSQVPRKQ